MQFMNENPCYDLRKLLYTKVVGGGIASENKN